MKRGSWRGSVTEYPMELQSSCKVLPMPAKMALSCFMSAGGRGRDSRATVEIEPEGSPAAVRRSAEANESTGDRDAFFLRDSLDAHDWTEVKLALFRSLTPRDKIKEHRIAGGAGLRLI